MNMINDGCPERIWIESDGGSPYFYPEEELSDISPPITEYVRADKLEELAAENEALRAEVERLSRYYKNGIDCFANPCERHSGERTPPFAEFFEKYGGQCLICVVDNNALLREALLAIVDEVSDGLVPYSSDSYLPAHLVEQARAALGKEDE